MHKATNNLHQILHAARCAFEPSALASGSAACPSSYLLLRDEQLSLCPDGPLWADVEAFEEAAATARYTLEPAAFRAAIDLYSGELLPEDRYEGWVEERRVQLKELYLSLLLELGALYEERGEYGEAIEALRRVVAQEPTREAAHAELMRLYALSGKRREALSQYERLREALNRDLGTEPEAALIVYSRRSGPEPSHIPIRHVAASRAEKWLLPRGAPVGTTCHLLAQASSGAGARSLR